MRALDGRDQGPSVTINVPKLIRADFAFQPEKDDRERPLTASEISPANTDRSAMLVSRPRPLCRMNTELLLISKINLEKHQTRIRSS